MSESARTVYTVMADNALGDFLWAKRTTDTFLVGGNVLGRMPMSDIMDQDFISWGLYIKFSDWVDQYLDGQPPNLDMPWDLDWEAFNARGIELTYMLKEELGDGVVVQYVRASEYPGEGRIMLVL